MDSKYKIITYAPPGENADAIIFGEYHCDKDMQVDQAKIISEICPEYVLLEGLNNLDEEKSSIQVKMALNHSSLEYLFKYFQKNGLEFLEEYRCPQNIMQSYKTYMAEREIAFQKAGYEPEDGEFDISDVDENNILRTSFSKDRNLEHFVRQNYLSKPAAEMIPNSDFSRTCQLHDFLEKTRRNMKHFRKSQMEIYEASTDAKATIVGCDLDKASKKEYAGLCTKREERMAEVICTYARKRKGVAPIFASIGAAHAKSQTLQDGLNQEGVTYKIYFPAEDPTPLQGLTYKINI